MIRYVDTFQHYPPPSQQQQEQPLDMPESINTISTSITSLDSLEYDDLEKQQSGPRAMVPKTSNGSSTLRNDQDISEVPEQEEEEEDKWGKMTMFNRFLGQFDPYLFIFVMGTGISSDLLYAFPYDAYWLRVCSYIMFAIACLLFINLQFMFILHMFYFTRKYSTGQYFNKYFRNLSKNIFWGTYPMGLVTIINYLNNLANHFHNMGNHPTIARHLMRLVYVLWWYDIIISVTVAWGVTFIIWQNYYFHDGMGSWHYKFEKMAAEHLKSVLLLAIIPMIVGTACSSIFTMSDLFTLTFTRNIQLVTMTITALIWLHAIIFVFILLFLYFWSLYVFKIPPMSQVFTMFLVLGPMGQGSFGILLLTNNIKKYVETYYHSTNNNEYNMLLIMVPWCFKIIGMLLAMGLLAMGYFFTIISIVAIISYTNKRDSNTSNGKKIYHFHQGFWGATFPMGTMSLGSNELFIQYDSYVPMNAFRVISAIYAVICILWTLYCLVNTIFLYLKRSYNAIRTRNELVPMKNEMELEPTVSHVAPETDFSFMREYTDDSIENDTADDPRQFGFPTRFNRGSVVTLPNVNSNYPFDMVPLHTPRTCPN